MPESPDTRADTPVENREQLVTYLERGCKAPNAWKLGVEHEKIVFQRHNLARADYPGNRGINKLLQAMRQFGWQAIDEAGHTVAMRRANAMLTLEPGGQFELSGAPLPDVHAVEQEVRQHVEELRQVGEELGLGFLSLGFDPKWSRDEAPKMPKKRYDIMRAYMPTRGALGLDMMHRSCTVQVNLDFDTERDMVRKFRASLALQPVLTALFANSPFAEGKPTGFLSYRSHIWTDTDPDRCGMLPFVFESGMGFERYVDYLLDMPMYFVRRNNDYINATGQSFRAFLDGKLPALPSEKPTMGDWADHITTAFPEVRLKHYLEMRGCDAGPEERLTALPALWAGLFYDSVALDAACALVADWNSEEREALRRDVTRLGLKARFRDQTVQDLAKMVLGIAREGLQRRRKHNPLGDDESKYLDPLDEIAASGRTPAENLLEAFHGDWLQSVDPAFEVAAL